MPRHLTGTHDPFRKAVSSCRQLVSASLHARYEVTVPNSSKVYPLIDPALDRTEVGRSGRVPVAHVRTLKEIPNHRFSDALGALQNRKPRCLQTCVRVVHDTEVFDGIRGLDVARAVVLTCGGDD